MSDEIHDFPAVYCVCRTSDISRFMIACEKCDEWYHGDCIHPLLTAKTSKNIEKYYCEACMKIDPSLAITYKPVKERKKSSSSKKTPKTPSAKSAAKKAKRPVSPSLSLHSHTSSKSSAVSTKADAKGDLSTSGSSKSSSSDDSDNWDVESKLGAARPRLNSVQSDSTPVQPKPRGKPGPKPKVDGVSRQRKSSGTSVKSGGPKRIGTKDVKKGPKTPKNPAALSTAQPVQNSSPAALTARVSPPKPPRTIKRRTPIHRMSDDESLYGEPEDYPGFDLDTLRQCDGPNCCFAAAPYSKYCSDECGRALARARLLHYMPLRLADTGDDEAAATQANNQEMDEVRKKLADCKTKLENMTANKLALERLIIAGKLIEPVSEEKERDSEDDADRNLDVHCITCGAPISSKLAIKHFERCFNRVENQTSYGSLHPAPNSIFCDVFNPKNKTYCKRLKVICPEHYKDAFEDTGVCGFPLMDSTYRFNGMFCNSFRKNCTRHPSWERIRRAEIDLEILRTYIKMEELAEQESVLMRTIQARGGIVQNLLNWTTKNEESSRISSETDRDEDIVCD